MNPTVLACSMMLFFLVFLVVAPSFADNADSDITYRLWGDVNLGGLFPVHFYEESAQDCGALRGLDALKRVEAMAYMVRQINDNETLLPNITLGYEIYDTCSYNAIALKQSLKMIPVQRLTSQCLSNSTDEPMPLIAGVVGAQRSASSLQAAILFGLYAIPQVSYLSTSDELSNDDRYPYFLRTVPPDRYQVKAMVDILLLYKWKYVSFINSDDTYGKSAQTEFRSRAADNDICLAVARTIPASTETYDELISDLLDTQSNSAHSTVVILFVQLETARNIFTAAAKARAYRRFIWIGSDGWGNYGLEPVLGNEEVALGAFTVVPLSGQNQMYNDYLKTLSLSNSDNPWLPSFLEEYGHCASMSDSTGCLSWTFEDVADIDVGSHETIVMDSVLTFAYGLHTMQLDKCSDPSLGLCENMTNIDGTEIRDYLLRTSFESPVNGRVEFQDNGDMGGRYGIKNLQLVDGRYDFLDAGTWVDTDSGERLAICIDIPWYIEGNYSLWDNATGVPQSVCSKPCETGQRRTVLPENPCCWSCTNCAPSEIVNHNGTMCSSCVIKEKNIYTWPNADREVCVDLQPVTIIAWTTAIVILSCLGLLGTIVTFLIYVLNREKPLIKASSRELSYIIFTGLFLAFLTALLYGVTPTAGVCAIRRMGSPVALSLIYVSIATKTIRLYRIFRAGLKTARRPRFISPTSQVTLTLIICIAPVVWASVWFILIPPAVEKTMPDINVNKLELTCAEDDIEVIGTLTWEICLIIVCCIFAFVTRKLPENYNESRFITFCVFSSLVVFSSFAPPFFTTNEAIYKASYSALGLIINGTVTLICLFVVKIYALYFVDENELNIFTQSRTRSNTRTNSMANVNTSDGSAPPASPTRTGPQANKGFENDVNKHEIGGSLNHSSNNNNNRPTLPPIINSMNPEQKGCNDIEKGLSRSSSKNSSGGSGRGSTSGSLMHRLRGNSTRVGDIDASHAEHSCADIDGDRGQQKGDLNSVITTGEVKGPSRSSGHKLAHLKGLSEDSTSSQSDDQRVLLNVRRQQKGSAS